MEREQSSMYARVRQRAAEREERAALELAAEMVWCKGSMLAIKDIEYGFRLVRCESDVQSSDVSSDTTFEATVFVVPKNKISWHQSEEVITVAPSDIIRPVKLNHESMMPQTVFQWLYDNHPPQEMTDEFDGDDGDERPRKSRSQRNNSQASRSQEGIFAGSEADDSDDAVAKPAAKGKATPKKTQSSPKASKVGQPKKPSAKPATKKQRLENQFPFVERCDALYGAGRTLDTKSHKEAMRAVLTSNVELFDQVMRSERHAAWIGTTLAVSDRDDSPLAVAFRQWKFPIIKYMLHSEKFSKTALQESSRNWNFQQNQQLDGDTVLVPIFDDLVVSHNSKRIETFGTSVASVNGSMLGVQGSGQARFQMLGRHVRNVAAGRGGRELGNAFTCSVSTPHSCNDWMRPFRQLLEDGKLSKEKFDEFVGAVTMSINEPAAQATAISELDKMVSNEVANLVFFGHTEWALSLLKKVTAGDTSNVTGAFHVAALDPTSTKLPESKQMRLSLLKQGLGNATPLHYACANPNSAMLRLILKELGDIPTVFDHNSFDVWHYAVMSTTTEALKVLQEHGVAFAPMPLSPKPSPMHLAAKHNRCEHLSLLLKDHAEQRLSIIHQVGNRHNIETPWITAATAGSADALRVMLDSVSAEGAKRLLKQVKKGTGLTALHFAAQYGYLQVVKLLVERKAPMEAKDKHKRTPLILAAKMGFLDIVSFLASNGGKLFAADSSGNQVIHYASAYGHFEILRYVVERGADINAETAWKMTPIGLALLSGYSSTCGSFLLSQKRSDGTGVDINFRDDKYDTLLLRMVRTARPLMMPQVVANFKFLLQIGADPSLADPKGDTVLHLLAQSACAHDQRLLLGCYLFRLHEMREKIIAAGRGGQNSLQAFAAALNPGSHQVSAEAEESAKNVEGSAEANEEGDESGSDDESEHSTEKAEGPHDEEDTDRDEEGDADENEEEEVHASKPLRIAVVAPGVIPPALNSYRYQIDNRLRCKPNELNTSSKWFAALKKEISAVEAELAVEDCDVELSKLLVKQHKCNVDAANNLGVTPLLSALQSAHTKFVEGLLLCGASTTVSDGSGNNLLHHLFSTADTSALQMVQERLLHADLTTMTHQLNCDGLSPLHILLASISKTSSRQPNDQAYVLEAISCLNAIVRKAGVGCTAVCAGPRVFPPDLEVTNQKPSSKPMVLPVDEPNFHKKDVLGEVTVDMSKVPPLPLLPQNAYFFFGGWTLLHFAATIQHANYHAIVTAILEKFPAASSVRDVFGRTPLMIAVLRNDLPLIKLLLQTPSSYNNHLPDINGLTSLMAATRLPTSEVLQFLLPHGRDEINDVDNLGRTVLHRIAAIRDLTSLELALHLRADPNLADKDGVTPLHLALSSASSAAFSTLEVEQLLLASGADADAVDSENRNVLHRCFLDISGKPRGDPIEAIGTMLAKIKNKQLLNARDKKFGSTPIVLSIVCKSLSSCVLLASRGAKLDVLNHDGNSPLAIALKQGSVDFAITLLQLGKARVNPDVNVFTVRYEPVVGQTEPKKIVSKETACRFAMQKGWNGVVYMLLEAGYSRRQAMMDAFSVKRVKLVESLVDKITVDDRKSIMQGHDESGRTLLHWLCSVSPVPPGEFASFQRLFVLLTRDIGLSPNATDSVGGNAPAHLVAGDLAVLLLLKEVGADMNAKNHKGLSPISSFVPALPATDAQREALLGAMNTLGASPNFVVKFGTGDTTLTAVTACLYGNDTKTLIALIQQGADLSLTDSAGMTLLSHAVKLSKTDAALILLRSGRDVGLNSKDASGNTALHHAILANNTTMALQIIETAGLDVNVPDNRLRTPLHTAVLPFPYGTFENTDIIRALLSAKAKTDAKDSLGLTPIDYTAEMASPKLRELLSGEFGLRMPTMSRTSSIISTQAWSRTHGDVDAETDATEYLKKIEEPLTLAPPKPIEVDRIFFKSKSGATNDVIQVWEGHDATMTKVDVQYGNWGMNMFYRMQVLHDVLRHVWILWTRWGRIGDEGQYQATPFPAPDAAVKEFTSIFKSKSSNEWAHRGDFVKAKGKYMFHVPVPNSVVLKDILLPFTDKELAVKSPQCAAAVTDLLKELCNVTTLSQAYKHTGVDCPLGRLPKETLEKAVAILGKIKTAIVTKDALRQPRPGAPLTATQIISETQTISENIAELSNDFYELVPHADFANDRISPPQTLEQLSALWNRVMMMKELQLSARLLLAARFALTNLGRNPLDYLLDALSIDVAIVPPISATAFPKSLEEAEYLALTTYVTRSCNERIHGVFRVQRKGEAENFTARCGGASPIDNHRLLFHGSGTSNILPILKEGLRIAPPEAPAHGYMFGKGIYFADLASKSMGYAHREADSAFLFLCEVACGTYYHRVQGEYVEQLPPGTHCTKALGQSCPDPAGDVVLGNGLIVPLGPIRAASYTPEEFQRIGLPERSRLQIGANEYIVYHPAQVRLRYIIQFKQEDKLKTAVAPPRR